jgi:phytoene desaturase
VLLPEDPWRAYAQLDAGAIPDELMVYVCNGEGSPPSKHASLTILVPVPNRLQLPEIDEEQVFAKACDVISRHAGPIAERVVYRSSRGPKEFERELGLAFGAAFGPSHDLLQMGPLRPPRWDRRVRNLAFAGSGTHPGSGVPMVILSGRLAAQRLLQAV